MSNRVGYISVALNTLALSFVLVSAGTVAAQNNECKLKLADLAENAELRGFKLGMTTAQVKARVPQVVFGKTDESGNSKTTINPHFDPRIDKSGFTDVRSVSLDFLDGRLTSLWIGYEHSFKWATVDDFVKGISDALSLPRSWSPWKIGGQQLKCADFHMTLSMVGGGPSFRILDLSAEETLTARRVAQEEEKEAANVSGGEPEPVLGDKKDKIYYPSGCAPSTEISEDNLVVFKTAEEAEKAGYKPAKNCPG